MMQSTPPPELIYGVSGALLWLLGSGLQPRTRVGGLLCAGLCLAGGALMLWVVARLWR